MLFLFGFVYPGGIVGFQFDDAEMVGPFPLDSSAQGGGQFGAAALLFIACSRRIGVKTDAMPLAPVISLALIAALAAGALS